MNALETIATAIKNETQPGQNTADKIGGLLLSICGLLNIYQNTLVVDPESGNYHTITAAKAAAASGDLIIVMPGTYDEADLAKNYVNYLFLPGARVEYDNSTSIWTDNNTAMALNVYGWGEFSNVGGGDAIRMEHASSVFNIHAKEIYSTARAIASYRGNIDITADLIQSSDGVIDSVGGDREDLTVKIRAKQIIGDDNYAIEHDGGDVYIYADEIRANDADFPAIGIFSGSGSLYIEAKKVKAVGYGYTSENDVTKVYLKGIAFDCGGTQENQLWDIVPNSSISELTIDGCRNIAKGYPFLVGEWGATYINKTNEIMILNTVELPPGVDPEVVHIDMGIITNDIYSNPVMIKEPYGYYPETLSIETWDGIDGLVDVEVLVDGAGNKLPIYTEWYTAGWSFRRLIELTDTSLSNYYRKYSLRADNNAPPGFRAIITFRKYMPHTHHDVP